MLKESAQDVMTFTTPIGSYKYVRLPFGLATAGSLFQRYMNQCLEQWLWRELVAIVDDVAMGTDTIEEHIPLVTNVFCRLTEKGFSVKAEKVKLFVKEFVFLGHLSTPEGLRATDRLVEAIKEMPVPSPEAEDPKKQLRSFLGLASYARKFVRNFSIIVQPLNQLLEKGVEFKWSNECQKAWDLVVQALAEKKGVVAPDYNLPLYVRTDACKEGLGAYLFQLKTREVPRGDKVITEKYEAVIEYWSRSVPKAMRDYDSRRLELLAVILALEHFKPYIDGVRVSLDTDHRNLQFIRDIKHSSGQLARWAMRLSEYDFELKYRPGKQMEVADCLSRNPLPVEVTEEDGTEFKNELMQNFLRQFKIRFGYSIPYHPQGNPVERVHRYAGAVLRIAVSRSDSVFDHWSEAVPYAEFSYNKKHIPGTDVSPFMLRNGFQPRYPSDFKRDSFVCENKTFQEEIDEITKRYQEMEKIVSEAHEIAKGKQKVNYDQHQYDVEFKVGDKVLWHCKEGLDKLHFKWHGPYTVVKKKSKVSYQIQDELDQEVRDVSVQQIVPFYGETIQFDDDDEFMDRRNILHSLRPGLFVVFKREDDRKWNALHVGEVVRPYNPITHEVRIHHFVDLGVSGKHWDPTKDLSSRRVYPEYSADGVSYVQKRSGVALKPGSQEVSIDYALHNRGSGRRITIIAKNFALQTGGKIPGDVCMKVREWLDARRPQQRR